MHKILVTSYIREKTTLTRSTRVQGNNYKIKKHLIQEDNTTLTYKLNKMTITFKKINNRTRHLQDQQENKIFTGSTREQIFTGSIREQIFTGSIREQDIYRINKRTRHLKHQQESKTFKRSTREQDI